jgi:hypothetical protein
MELIIEDVIARTPDAMKGIAGSLPDGFPAQIAEATIAGVRERVEQLKKELVK